ncbi:MAG: hypothetical protein COV76_04850 [Candidatus Omnitrophica bacterium CG11_big_fil_rev_8_21_14_0_20_64_10]|nr:MAG: hypothetical protein COV76_04850 [Candidatus Omnitrophica bacterium CG11_big_fil_rev_8_21_14_0_20_64_10]
MKKLLLLLTVLSLTAAPLAGPVRAEEIKPDAGTKLRRGIMNIGFGWAEVPIWVSEGFLADDQWPKEVALGFGFGLVRGIGRTLAGVWDTATFIIPPYDHPLMEPETAFGETP